MSNPIALCAHGEAAWHAVAYESLGAAWVDDGRLARAGRPAPRPLVEGRDLASSVVPHRFLLGAVTLIPDATVPDDVPGIVCDSWARLSLPGREAEPTGCWMIRAAGRPGAVPQVPGLEIRRVVTDADVAWFEYIAFLAADGELPSRSGELHPPGSQRLPGLTLLVAEIDGEGVGTALSVATDRVNNIGAVTVMPAQRGRGIASQLAEAAVAAAPGVPATLSATVAGRGVYRRLGFNEVGRPLHHHPVD